MPDPTGGFVSFSNNKEIKGEIPSKLLQPLNHNLQLRKAKSGGPQQPAARASIPETLPDNRSCSPLDCSHARKIFIFYHAPSA